MKKNYKTPMMKVRTIQCSHMLCGSNPNNVKFYRGQSVKKEDNDYADEEGYGVAW